MQEIEKEFLLVRLGDLQVPDFQRPDKPTLQRKIEKEFDDRLFGVPVAWEHDGRYDLLDGQQRTASAIRRYGPDIHARVEILRDLRPGEAVQIYVDLNKNRVRVTAGETFVAKLSAHDPASMEIQGLVQKNLGCDVGSRNGIRAVEVLERLYKVSPGHLDRVLRVASRTFAAEGARNNLFLGGLSHFLRRYPQAEDDRIARVVSGAGSVHALAGQAKGLLSGGSGAARMSDLIRDLYNKGLRSTRLP